MTRTGLCVNRYCFLADFQFFKMAAVRHLGFLKVENYNFLSHSEAQYASSYQISRRSVEPFQRYFRFAIFQDGGSRHLEFWKFETFNVWDAQEGRTASACQILSKSLKPLLGYGHFSIFQDGGRPPSWIFKSWKFQLPFPFVGPICVIVPNFAKIGRTVPETLPIFDFSRWRPSAILDWFYTCWDHPRRAFGGLCDCAKFGGNLCSNFDSMQISIFCTLSLKMPIHAPKIRFFGGFYPQNGKQYVRSPQKAHPWAETRRMTYRSSKSVHVCGLGARRRIK